MKGRQRQITVAAFSFGRKMGKSLEEWKIVCIFAATLIIYYVYVELWKKDYRIYI